MKKLILITVIALLIGCSNGHYIGPKAGLSVSGYGVTVSVSTYTPAQPTPEPSVPPGGK